MVVRNRRGWRQPGKSVKIEVVLKIVGGKRDSRTRGKDTHQRPASERLTQALSALEPGSFPDGINDEALPDIKVRVTPIQLRVGKKSVAKGAVPIPGPAL